jgi:hypothetical protein
MLGRGRHERLALVGVRLALGSGCGHRELRGLGVERGRRRVAVPFSTTSYGSVVHAAAALRRSSHTPGAGYTEIAELSEGNGNNTVGLATLRQTRIIPESVSVAGSLDSNTDWAIAAVEIRQQIYFRPSVTGFTPTSGLPGAEVVVTGSNFPGANLVRFGAISASFTLGSDTQLRAVVPAGATTGPISVRNPAGTGSSASSFSVAYACANGLDDDGDGLADFPADPGCNATIDTSERESGLACDDGTDQDADGLADFPADPGCRDAFSTTERPQCDDGIDNDGDGRIDWDGGPSGGPADSSCGGHGWGPREKLTRCGLGFELALVLPLLATLRRRRRR